MRTPSDLAATTPYESADVVGGVGVFSGVLRPRSFAEHAHPETAVDVCYPGTSCLATWETAGGRRRTQLLRDGHVSVVPGGMPHASEWRTTAEHVCVYLSPAFLDASAADLLRPGAVELVEDRTADDPFVRSLAGALRSSLRHGRAPDGLHVESLATALSGHLLSRYSARPGAVAEPAGSLPRAVLARVADHVSDHLAGNLTLAALAAEAGLSPFHFARAFKRATGRTPHAYVVSRRVRQAQRLLLAGRPISEVARAVGFCDQSHLARHTRRLLGATPQQLRAAGAATGTATGTARSS